MNRNPSLIALRSHMSIMDVDNRLSFRSKRKIDRIRCRACGEIFDEPDSKRRRTSPYEANPPDFGSCSSVFTMGLGDSGQLGLGPHEMEQSRPTIVNNLPGDIVQVAAGGLHSVCVTNDGRVMTFGLNDEGTLGRITSEEEHCFFPIEVGFNVHVVEVSAGDSHTAAMAYNGRLFIWGTFRDSEGHTYLIHGGPDKCFHPVEVMRGICVVKVSSGTDHVLCLTEDNQVYSFGNNERGQLGRTSQEDFIYEDDEPSPMLLRPGKVRFPSPLIRLCNIWAGGYSSFAKSTTGDIYAWGLNNVYQLGFGDMQSRPLPEKWATFGDDKGWKEIAPGFHHTLALDNSGVVFSVGRGDSGQLGIGQIPDEYEQLRRTLGTIPRLEDVHCVAISSGASAVSFAVTVHGTVYCWGMGVEQLGLGELEDSDIYVPTPISGNLKTRRVFGISAGGQHTILLTEAPMSKPYCDVHRHIQCI